MIGSFRWSEDFNESLNYWFWRRKTGGLSEDVLIQQIRHTLDLPGPESHLMLAAEADFNEFLGAWRSWKRDQASRQAEQARTTTRRQFEERYKQLAGLGIPEFTIQWVMAPIGEQWILPHAVVVLGVDGATPAQRWNAVIDGARALMP